MKSHTQIKNPTTGDYAKRNETLGSPKKGEFMDNKKWPTFERRRQRARSAAEIACTIRRLARARSRLETAETFQEMKRRCPACGARESDDLLVVCPKCGASYDEEPLLVSRPELLALEKRILKQLTRKVSRFVFGGFSVMTLIAVVTLILQFRSLWSTGVNRLQSTLTTQIAAEFKTERIRKTVLDVADKEAKTLLRESLQPQIDKAVAETKTAVKSFGDFLGTLRQQINRTSTR